MIGVATLRTRLIWLGGKARQSRVCCVRECRRTLPWRVGGRQLEVIGFDSKWHYQGAVCYDCAVSLRAYHFHNSQDLFILRRGI